MVDKTPGQMTPGTPSRDSIVHSTEKPSDLSRGHREDDISRLQSAIHPFDNNIQYKVNDLVTESGIPYRNITPNTPPAAFVPSEWTIMDEHTMQKAYDGGEIVQLADGRPVQWLAPASPLFQPIHEFVDQNGKTPVRINAGGEIEQQPINLMTSAVIEQGDNGASLVSATHLETHSRYLFANTEKATEEGIEIFSLANPEMPRHLMTITDANLTTPKMFKMKGDILYVIEGSSPAKLLMFDIGNPIVPKLLGIITSGDIGSDFDADSQLIVDGKYLFLTRKGTMPSETFINVIDISDPTNPILVNKIGDNESGSTGGNYVLDQIGAMEIHENFLFVANHSNIGTIECLDISKLDDILHVSNLVDGAGATEPFLNQVVKIHVTRDIVFFSSFMDKSVQAVDYKDPFNPVATNSVRDGIDSLVLGNVTDTAVSGRYLYVYSAIGVSNPQSITTFDVQEAGDATSSIVFLQTSMIDPIVPLQGLLTSGMAITGDHIYALNNDAISQLYAVRLSGIDLQSARIGSGRFGKLDVKDSMTARNLDVSESLHVGTRGILSNGPISGQKSATIKTVEKQPMRIISPDSPAPLFEPVLEIQDQDKNMPTKIEGGGGIEQKPYNLELVNTINDGDNNINLTFPGMFEAHSRYVFITNAAGASAGIEIISITNPEDPEHIALIQDGGGNFLASPTVVKHHGDKIYAVSDQGGGNIVFSIIDISDPTNPVTVGSIAQGDDGAEIGNDIIIQGKFAYVLKRGTAIDDGHVTILDISNPSDIVVMNVVADGDDGGSIKLSQPRTFTIHEDFMWVSNQDSGSAESVECLNISDPLNVTFVSRITDGSGSVPYLAGVSKIHATRDVVHFFGFLSRALQIVDYADPANPVSKGFLKDGVNGVVLGEVDGGVVAGKFAYVSYFLSGFERILTVDVMDAMNPTILKENAVVGSTGDQRELTLLGNHLYLLSVAASGKIFILKTSGIDTQAIRSGAIRAGHLDVKDEMSARLADVSESLHVGTRGILSNGPIAGQDGSQIKRKVTTLVGTGTPAGTFTLDMSEDVSVYIIDVTGSASGVWQVDVINQRPGNKILIKGLLTPFDADIGFSDAKFAVDTGNTDVISVDGDLAVLECVLDDGSADSIICTVTEIA